MIPTLSFRAEPMSPFVSESRFMRVKMIYKVYNTSSKQAFHMQLIREIDTSLMNDSNLEALKNMITKYEVLFTTPTKLGIRLFNDPTILTNLVRSRFLNDNTKMEHHVEIPIYNFFYMNSKIRDQEIKIGFDSFLGQDPKDLPLVKEQGKPDNVEIAMKVITPKGIDYL